MRSFYPAPSHQADTRAQKLLQVIKVTGDGDCLFHALAFIDGYDGGALRIDVANFMEENAQGQPGFQEEWVREVGQLRASKWGGHTATIAYSLMRNTRVMVHTFQAETKTVTVEEVSHASIHRNDAVRLAHILYNGCDHYDALVELTDPQGLAPAWPQPPPPVYFALGDSEFPTLAQSNPKQSGAKSKRRPAAPRPPKKGKAKGKGNAKPKPAPVKPEACGGASEAGASAAADSGRAPHHECEGEGEGEDYAKPGLMEALEDIPVAEASLHPHRHVEDLVKEPLTCNVGNVLTVFWVSHFLTGTLSKANELSYMPPPPFVFL